MVVKDREIDVTKLLGTFKGRWKKEKAVTTYTDEMTRQEMAALNNDPILNRLCETYKALEYDILDRIDIVLKSIRDPDKKPGFIPDYKPGYSLRELTREIFPSNNYMADLEKSEENFKHEYQQDPLWPDRKPTGIIVSPRDHGKSQSMETKKEEGS